MFRYHTIRLRALNLYAVIVDEHEARSNYHRIEIKASNCFGRIRDKNYFKVTLLKNIINCL